MSDDKKKESSDGEDIPSDFFDDFNKEDFMEGLSVIDSWNQDEQTRPRERMDEETFDGGNEVHEVVKTDAGESFDEKDLDDYIKPGSRRDPSKTQEAIRRDKEVKVKEYLAKHLESIDDLRPPGTELDEYYDETITERRKIEEKSEAGKRFIKEKNYMKGYEQRPPFKRHQPTHYKPYYGHFRDRRESPSRYHYKSPGRYKREYVPRHRRETPPRYCQEVSREEHESREFRRSRNYSPHQHHSPRFSPRRSGYKPNWSPHRSPPRPQRYGSPNTEREHRSKSHYRQTHDGRRSRSSSYHRERDNFQYHTKYGQPKSSANEYEISTYQYPQGSTSYSDYNQQYLPTKMEPQQSIQQLPAPSVPLLNPSMIAPPSMVPAPPQTSLQQSGLPINPIASQIFDSTSATPYDALAKLVADGKLSHEDYLKLAPNKGFSSNMDAKERVSVLNRCSVAIMQLGKLTPPNRLLVNNKLVSEEQKSIAPKYCSPLKRQSAVSFHFSKSEQFTISQRNKQIIDSIICALSLDKIVARPNKKVQRDVQEVSVQTLKPTCEVCEIRETTKFCDASTSTEPQYFSSSVHTQVIEQDLFSSKSVFNPSGSISDSAPISIAHLTPAQLVSQLAARAKTLKQSDQSQSSLRGNRPNFDYDYRRGGNSYQNHNHNFRY